MPPSSDAAACFACWASNRVAGLAPLLMMAARRIGSRRVMEKLGMCLTWVAMPDDCADPDLADVEYELSRAQWELGQAPTVRFRRIATGHSTKDAVSGGRHRRAATTELPFIATEAG